MTPIVADAYHRNEIGTNSRYLTLHAMMALGITEVAMVTLLNQLAVEEANRDELDDVVDEIVLASSGDIRQAIRGLVLGQYAIEAGMRERISHGYVRGRR